MKKIISLVLAIMMIASAMTFASAAATATIDKAKVKTPTVDGKIGSTEYSNALVTSFNPDKATYYAYSADRSYCVRLNNSDVVARGSKMLGSDTKFYALPTEEGIYFAFDVRDTTYGSNYVKDFAALGSFFNGDAVHVTIRTDNNNCNDDKFYDGDAVRFSVAPFVQDYKATTTSQRTLKVMSAITLNTVYETNMIFQLYDGRNKEGSRDCLGFDGYYKHECTTDESGYQVELFVAWDLLDYAGFNGPTSFENGGKLYINFEVTDAMGATKGGTLNGQTDWAIYICPINSEFVILNDHVVVKSTNGDPDTIACTLDGGCNYGSFKANTADCITLVNNSGTTTQKDTSKATDTKKATETTKPNETKSNETKKTHTETKVIEHVETKKNGETVIVTETETIIVEDETEVTTETETDKATEKATETQKETKKSDKKVSDDNSSVSPVVIILIVVAVLVVGGAVAFIIIKKKKNS